MSNYNFLQKIEKVESLLDGEIKMINELIGLENTCKFLSVYAGNQLYFSDNDLKRARIEYIKNNYENNAHSKRKICLELGINEYLFKKLLAEMK